jgi:type IV secretion system protein VirD4
MLDPTSPRPRSLSGSDIALIAVLVLIAGVAVTVWLTGELAALLASGHTVVVDPGDLAHVIVRLPGHLADPARAWPPRMHAALPGPAVFYLSTALVIAAAAGVAIGLLRLRTALGLGGADRRGSRWARGGDLRALRVRRPRPGRLTLGRVGGGLVATEERHSAIVIAPTQSYKTVGLGVPAILEWQGPVLAASVKTDLLHNTRPARQRAGEVMVFDPVATTGVDRASWTPLIDCATWGGARRTAERLAQAGAPSARALEEADFWSKAGAKFLAPLLFAGALDQRTMVDVMRWIDVEPTGQTEVTDVLTASERAPERERAAALAAAEAVWNADPRLRASLYMTAAVALDAYGDPTVIECSQHAELTPSWLLAGGPRTTYLCAPQDEQQRLRPLFVTLISSVLSEVYDRATRTGKPLDPPLLVVLDEVANIAPLPNLDGLASTAAGQGIQLVTVVQDLAQMRARWGDRAATIVNNHRAKIVGAGISDTDTLQYLARLLGDQEITQVSATAGETGRRSTTESSAFRALAPAHLVREGKPGTALLVYGNLPPARLRLRPWFSDPGAPPTGRDCSRRSGLARMRLVHARRASGGAPGGDAKEAEQGGQEDAVLEQHDRKAAQDHGDAERPLDGPQDASSGARGTLDGHGLSVRP